MCYMVLDPAVKNIFQRMFPHKLEAQDSHCLAKLLICPKIPNLFNRINMASTKIDKVRKLTLIESKSL